MRGFVEVLPTEPLLWLTGLTASTGWLLRLKELTASTGLRRFTGPRSARRYFVAVRETRGYVVAVWAAREYLVGVWAAALQWLFARQIARAEVLRRELARLAARRYLAEPVLVGALGRVAGQTLRSGESARAGVGGTPRTLRRFPRRSLRARPLPSAGVLTVRTLLRVAL